MERLPAQPEVSVLIPVCDAPLRRFGEAARIVLAQAYPDWELCIADDASEDRRFVACSTSSPQATDGCGSCTAGRSGGITAASNTALAAARGELCGLLDHWASCDRTPYC